MLLQELAAKKYEFNLSTVQTLFYTMERKICHATMRRFPPALQSPNLLNLGCGPHIFSGWVNADDYAIKRRLRERQFRPNWHLDITKLWRCADNYWDGIFTEHVLEHLAYSEAIFALKESLRTLKPSAWIRISVPDIAKYVSYYCGNVADANFPQFPSPAVAISFVTQMHHHRSVWNSDLMVRVLTELGFQDAKSVSFRIGSDPRIIRDDADKMPESLYVEARKPDGG
jgi:predicted SAM-dependent methyltransferase